MPKFKLIAGTHVEKHTNKDGVIISTEHKFNKTGRPFIIETDEPYDEIFVNKFVKLETEDGGNLPPVFQAVSQGATQTDDPTTQEKPKEVSVPTVPNREDLEKIAKGAEDDKTKLPAGKPVTPVKKG